MLSKWKRKKLGEYKEEVLFVGQLGLIEQWPALTSGQANNAPQLSGWESGGTTAIGGTNLRRESDSVADEEEKDCHCHRVTTIFWILDG